MNDSPQIFAFYSFKGGVGRSMALLNVAYALAAKGRNILVLDMDLEAPGVSGFLHREKEFERFAPRDMVDLVEWAKQARLPVASDAFPSRTDYVVSIAREKLEPIPRRYAELGRLDIIPVDEERSYYERLANLALSNVDIDQGELVRIGSVLRDWLKSLCFPVEVPDYYGPDHERTAHYDYILVDSRTGITETGGLCIGPMSDHLVVLTALNDQNITGTRGFLIEVGVLPHDASGPQLDGDDDAAEVAKPYLVVASLVPAGEIEKKQERLDCLRKELGRVDLKLSYHPQLALKETIFTRDYRDENLAGEYERLLARMLEMAGDRDQSRSTTLAIESPGSSVAPTTGRGDSPRLKAGTFWPTQSSDEVRESIDALARAASISESSSGQLLGYLRLHRNWNFLTSDRDYVLWDRVCRTLASGDGRFRPEVVIRWANLLAGWGLQTTDPERRRLRFRAALDRYTQAIQDPNTTPYQRSLALVNRGIVHGYRGRSDEKAADCSTVIAMPDAPADLKAVSLINRGWWHFRNGRHQQAIDDQKAAICHDPGNWKAHGNLAIALLISGRWEEARDSYDQAIALAEIDDLNAMVKDLDDAVEKQGSIPWAEQARGRLEARREFLTRRLAPGEDPGDSPESGGSA